MGKLRKGESKKIKHNKQDILEFQKKVEVKQKLVTDLKAKLLTIKDETEIRETTILIQKYTIEVEEWHIKIKMRQKENIICSAKKRIALMPSTSLKIYRQKKKDLEFKLKASKAKAAKARELKASAEAIIVKQKALIETLMTSKASGWELKVKAAEQLITEKQTIITQQVEIISITYTEIKEIHFDIIQEEEYIDYSYSVISKGKKSTKASRMISSARKNIKNYRRKKTFIKGQL